MPEFTDPFSGVTPDRPFTHRELTRALRLALAAEEEAIHLYEAMADACTNELAKEVLQDIADEEREHVGEFQRVLGLLVDDEYEKLETGRKEVDEMAEKLAGDGDGGDGEGPPAAGGLKEGA